MRVTWIGHSTVAIESDGTRLLTDPLLRQRVAHLGRVAAAAPPLAAVPDAILVSHVHYDHLDLRSLQRLGRGVPVVAPRGAGRYLRRHGFGDVTEVVEGDELPIGSVVVRATPAAHYARRGVALVPALGYVVAGSARAYFAGDTDLFDGMAELAPGLDLALLPVAGWGAKLPPGHLDPRRAAEALLLLRPRIAVPIHWGTYRSLALARLDAAALRAPATQFAAFARELAPEVDVRLLAPGAATEIAVRERVCA